MIKQYRISGIDHIIKLLQQYPQLMSLSSLTPIREIAKKAQEAVRKSGCGCSAAQVYAANKSTFERALDIMGSGDHLTVKSVLNVDQICYGAKDSAGKPVVKCI